jgi:hypothetical protein
VRALVEAIPGVVGALVVPVRNASAQVWATRKE